MNKYKAQFILGMLIVGTIGLFRRAIFVPSSVLSLSRGLIAVVFLLLLMLFRREKPDFAAVKKNLVPLLLSGIMMGVNWVAIFEAYQYTSIAITTLCNYMAPVFVILASPFILKDRLTLKKLVCVFVAFFGMVLVSGVFESGLSGILESGQIKGMALGVFGAVLYAAVIFCNMRMDGIGGRDKTLVQLAVAAAVLFPYVLLTEDLPSVDFSGAQIPLLVIIGVVHTGIAYSLYFGAVGHMKAQSVAILGYIDPITAILLAALFLKEGLSPLGIVGVVLVLGATLANELIPDKKA